MSRLIPMVGLCLLVFSAAANAQTPQRLSLFDAISFALRDNERILTAHREVEAASGRILQAGRIPNPDLTVTYNEIPTSLSIGEAGERDIGITQPFEFPGKRGARVDAAETEYTIAGLSLGRIQRILTSEVKLAYYKALLAGEVVDNLQFTISLVNDFLGVVTQRYQAGTSTYLDVLRAKVEITRLRNDLVGARRDYQIRLSELNVGLGLTHEQQTLLTDSLRYTPFMMSEDSTLALYTRESKFLEMTAREVARSRSLLSLAEKSYLPDFSLGAALQKRPGQLSPAGSANYVGLTFGVSLPLWFWQGPRGEVQEAQASLDASSIRLEATRRRIRQNISAAYRTVQVAEEQLNVFDTSLLRDVEDELRAGIAAYQNNQIDALNLFDIYRTYRVTKIEYARALYNFSAAVAQLESAGELPE